MSLWVIENVCTCLQDVRQDLDMPVMVNGNECGDWTQSINILCNIHENLKIWRLLNIKAGPSGNFLIPFFFLFDSQHSPILSIWIHFNSNCYRALHSTSESAYIWAWIN